MEHQQAWPTGFSPGPVSVSMSPEHGFEFDNPRAGATADEQPDSPLVFMRTPGINISDNTCPDSSKRFTSWMESTSPYTARKTPPTASMKSMAAGDENTPPAHGLNEKGSSFGSQQHFQAWLQATNSTSWTPRKSPAAGTPPPPAPSPAGTPMNVMRDLQHSAATPSSTQQYRQAAAAQQARSAAAAGDGFDTSDSEDDDAGEASTTIWAAQLAAAADRAAAASRMAGLRAQAGSSGGSLGATHVQQQQQRHLSTPPRVPAPSPAGRSPAVFDWQDQQASVLQAAADRMAQDCLATPMSQLSLSRGTRLDQQGGSSAAAAAAGTPGALVDGALGREAASGPPASPAEKLIGLMLSPGAGGHRRHPHHHHQQQGQLGTPSRLSAATGTSTHPAEPPMSPNLQVLDLMMHPDAAAGEGQASIAGGSSTGMAEGAAGGEESDGCASSNSGSYVSSESDDEMDLAELQALCGEGVGPDTPLSVILGMLTGTPEVAGLTPRVGASGEQAQQGGDDIGPRVLFADD